MVLVQESESLSDSEVVDRVLAGEKALYELLMRRYNQRLFRMVRSVLSNDSEAEDVLQEAWVRAYQHLEQFEGRSSFPTWVTRIAFHEALARARKGKRWMPIENDEGEIMPEVDRRSQPESPESQAMRAQLAEVLQSSVDGLPQTYRSVFVLREVEGLSTSETAACLALSEEAVKTRLHRSRALLRRELAERIGPAVTQAYSFLGARCDRTVAAVLARIA